MEKKFKKKGRTVSVDFTENYTDQISTGYLFSQNDFFTNDTISFAKYVISSKQTPAKH